MFISGKLDNPNRGAETTRPGAPVLGLAICVLGGVHMRIYDECYARSECLAPDRLAAHRAINRGRQRQQCVVFRGFIPR